MVEFDRFSRAYDVWAGAGGLSRLQRVVLEAAAEAEPLLDQGFELPAVAALRSLAATIGQQIEPRPDPPPGAMVQDWLALYSAVRGLTDAVDMSFSNAWSMLESDSRWQAALRMASELLSAWGSGGQGVRAALDAVIERSYHSYQAANR